MSLVFGEDLGINPQPYKDLKLLQLPILHDQLAGISLLGTAPDSRALFKSQVAKPSRLVSSAKEFEEVVRASYPVLAEDFIASLPPAIFKKAELLIQQSLSLGQRIGLVFDLDLDGLSSAAIVAETLRLLKPDIDLRFFPVANPKREISNDLLHATKVSNCNLIFFLDLGTIQDQAVRQSREQGQSAIVIDHHYHQKSFESSANVFINLRDEVSFADYSSSHLSAQLSRQLLGRLSDSVSLFASFGIVADGVRLSTDNRLMLSKGLNALRKSDLPFADAIKRQICRANPSAEDLAMRVVPLFNAARRSGVFKDSELVDLLLRSNPKQAQGCVSKMELLHSLAKREAQVARNEQQQDLSREVISKTNIIILIKDKIYSTRIEANRICRESSKPTFIFKRIRDEQGRVAELSGSAKAPDFDFFDLTKFLNSKRIVDCLLRDKHGRIEFGGHKHAIYLKVDPSRLEEFLQCADDLLAKQCQGRDLLFFNQPMLEMPLALIKVQGLELLELIKKYCEPTGQAFPAPLVYLSNVRVGVTLPLTEKIEGSQRMMISQSPDGLDAISAISFSFRAQYLKAGDRVDLIAKIILEDIDSKRDPQQQLAALQIEAVLSPVSR